jgi:5-methylcytosine-specific restriction enzyme B
MSREGFEDVTPVFDAALRWKDEALLNDRSVFGAGALWTLDGFRGLERYFVENLDEGEGSFMGKLQGQLAQAPSGVKQLASELTWAMLLCPSNTHPPKKRETIDHIWTWSKQPLPPGAHGWLTDEVLGGCGSAGPGYNNHRWRELVFAIRFGLAFKALSAPERRRLLTDDWGFAEWLAKLPEAHVRQFRHMLVYMLFPDTFERIFGGGDRRLLVQKFRGLSRAQVRKLSPIQIDREFSSIRAEQQAMHPDLKLDFYKEPLRSKWQEESGFEEYTGDVEAIDVTKAIEEIDQKGVPASAESTIYDLIYKGKRYPPKLVLSLAAKHATGKEFDRTMFSGGIDSPAFELLRSLGFDIERKDLIPELLKKFLAQAMEGKNFAVKGYPSDYRGLRIRIGFGQGSPAKVPWIVFLGKDQDVQEGIYPALLYYKAARVLVLAKGISETNPPAQTWPLHKTDKTIDAYFTQARGIRPERYGTSIVVQDYKIPLDASDNELNADLDKLIDEYGASIGAEGAAPKGGLADTVSTVQPSAANEPEPEPYTVSQATEALFMSQERFEEILAIWKQKKNLVVQGPPGVGKTFFHRQLAYALMSAKAPSRVASVQFHPSYAYEDFVQGYRPDQGGFRLRDGLFLRFCERARKDGGNAHVFVIDEINRGNLAKIFGELLMLLEADKRSAEWAVPLAYGTEEAIPFYVPDNLFVLGLMNTADRSLAVVDYALRRRFAFVALEPAFSSPRFVEYLKERGVADGLVEKIVSRMNSLNTEIAQDKTNLGPGFRIGHSFFCNPPEQAEHHTEWFEAVVNTEIGPLLDEYYFDDPEKSPKLVKRLLTGS